MSVDLSIPDGLPSELVARLLVLREELEEGDITEKGYRKHREQILTQAASSQSAPSIVGAAGASGSEHYEGSSYAKSERSASLSMHVRRQSGFESILSWEQPPAPPAGAGASVGGPGVYMPTELVAGGRPLSVPLMARGIPETAQTDPLNVKYKLDSFDNLPSILRHRGRTNGDILAFQALDSKGRDSGKEAPSITWAKLASRAEKVSQMLREQSGMFRGDRVLLVYGQSEPIEFVTSLMGCFLAGMVAVPVSQDEALTVLPHVLQAVQSNLVLTSDSLLKVLQKQHQNWLAALPSELRWWKTSEWGSYTAPKKGQGPPVLQVPDLAYIEFVRSAAGELRGVVMSHRTILHEMMCLTAILQSRRASPRESSSDRVLCSLDIRRSTGLIVGVLLTVYSGNCCFILNHQAMTTPGLYAHVLSKHRATVLLSDYPALKGVCYNYQSQPAATRQFSKKHAVDLSRIRWVLIDAVTADPEFQTILADRWLTPLGNQRARQVVAPMLTLMEHGGMIIAMRDSLSGEQGDPLDEVVHISRAALAHNEVELVADTAGMPVGTFGCPIPDATVAIVDPDTHILAAEMMVGEIWIDSPSLSGGFWAHAQDTETTFHAHCFDTEGPLSMEFLRSGLLGFIIKGKVFVLGSLSDRILQISDSGDDQRTYFYSPHLMETIVRSIPQIFDGCVFQIPNPVDTFPLSVVLIETPMARKPGAVPPTTQNADKEMAYLEEMATQVLGVLEAVHKFRVFAVVLTWPNAAPRTLRSGRPDIAKPATRRQFCRGSLQAAHIKYNMRILTPSLPVSEDCRGGIWSPATSQIRTESLLQGEQQYSGVDMRTDVVDDRMSRALDKFESIVHILQWRLTRQPDELAYLTVEGKVETSWKQLDKRIAAVASYLITHLKAKQGDVALCMYTHSQDYVVAVLACFLLGITVIPLSPVNLDRATEDINALVRIIRQFKVTFLLGNFETYAMMEEKQLTHQLKQRKVTLPKLHNTAKVKVNNSSATLTTVRNKQLPQKALQPNFPALIWLYFNSDHDFVASHLNHSAILGMCKIQKETCQMSSTKPIIGCVRSVSGLGFLYTCCLGVFMGASTILVSPVDYANNPAVYFVTMSRYKVKDGYATQQMLHHACRVLQKPKGFDLSEVQNIVVPSQGRADPEISGQMRLVFADVGLETVAVNLAYGTTGNPMVTTRSYMLVESIDIWLDPIALRQGRVSIVNPTNCPDALHLQDSGMVPINTQVAIVNPETKRLCRTGEYGEIWVVSDGNQASGMTQEGVIVDGDPNIKYMRTGDLGFLHSVTKGQELEMQVLFVIGHLRNTFEVNGLQHFAQDVEKTVLDAHNSFVEVIAVSAGKLSCIIVETTADRKLLSSLSAVIATEVLQKHQFGVNIVSFVAKGGIPMSRLQEKQRRKVVAQYVDGTLKLIGHYAVTSTDA